MIHDTFDLLENIPEVGEAFSFMGSLVEFTQLLGQSGDQPVPSLPNQVEVTAANAGATIAATYQKASDGMSADGDYMVQDPQKLLTGAYDLSKGDLLLDNTRATALKKTAAYGMRQFLWGTILGTSYSVWTGDAALPVNPVCGTGLAGYFKHPFGNMDGSGRWGWSAPNSKGAAVNWWIAQNQTSKPDEYLYRHNDVGLPAAVTQKLFGTIDPSKDATDDSNNVGAVAPYFQLKYLPFASVHRNPDHHADNGCITDNWQ